MNRIQITSKLFVTVLLISLSSISWSQSESIDKLAGGNYLAAHPPGPYNWYPPPAPWGPPPGWMPPPRAYGVPAYAMQPAPTQTLIATISSERDKLKTDLDTQQNELSDTRDQLVQAQASLEEARNNINTAQTDALKKQNDQVALNEKLAAVTAESYSSKSQLNQLNEQIETLNQAVNQQKSELGDFQQRAGEQQAEIEQLLGKVTEGDDKVAKLQAELAAVTASYETTKSESTATDASLSAMESQQQSCQQELADLSSKFEQESTLTQDKNQEVLDATAKYDELSTDLSVCTDTLAEQKAELEITQSEVDRLLVRLLPEKTQEATKSNHIVAEQSEVVEKKSTSVVAAGGERIKSAAVSEFHAAEITSVENEQTIEPEPEKLQGSATQDVEQKIEPVLIANTPETNNEELVKMPANTVILDFDRDGINDTLDLCLDSDLVSEVDVLGCSSGQPIVMDGVVFSYDSHELTREARGVLDNIAAILVQYPDLKLEVAGHSDIQGNADYNRWLSGLRAGSVKDYLIRKGLRKGNLTAHGYGPDSPIATNDTREGLHMNRRVELRRLE